MVHHVTRIEPPILIGFDSAQDTTRVLVRAVAAGVSWIARYYSFNTRGKNLSKAEASAILGAGLDIVSIWEAQGDQVTAFSYDSGEREASTALAQAQEVGQPQGTAIYFAVDFDATAEQIRDRIIPYFRGVNNMMAGRRVGAYGSGLVLSRLDSEGLVSYDWLAGARGWQGSRAYANAALTEIEQDTPSDPWGFGFRIDRNESRAGDFGSWRAGAPEGPPPPILDVIEQILSNVVFREGVRVYQRPRGLVQDGQIGPLTLRQIGEDMRESR